MRLSALTLLAGVAALARAQALAAQDSDKQIPVKEVPAKQEPAQPEPAQQGPVEQDTTFDSKTVPLLLELTPDTWEAASKRSRLLLVKHYSPYCPHCIAFAPVFQTMYEWYYTSTNSGGVPFSKYYDFRFATMNCVAYRDFCEKLEIKAFPTTVLYENGERVEVLKGSRSMQLLHNFIEPILEKAKPGSRPKDMVLPEPGAKESPKAPAKNATDEVSTVKPAEPGDSSEKTMDKAPNKTDKSPDKVADADKAEKTFGSGWKMPTPADKAMNKKPQKPLGKHNVKGESVPLTEDSFQKLVTMTQDPWFIKFYTPWCPHCRAMGPTWEQVAKSMRGKLNIGEVNCDKESHLCKDVNARAYPTIIFFKGGERAEYTGLRGLGDFVQFADKAIDLASGVPDVDAKTLKELEQKEEVIFVYFYDHATTSEDLMALERLPLSLIGHAKLVKTKDPALNDRFKITTWPRLLVSREGRPTYYPPLTPDEMRDVRGVLDWMKSVWLPLVPELTPSNARQVMDGKIVVLGILNHEDQDAFQSSLREMKSAANEWMDRQVQEFQLERKKLRDSKQMRIEEAEDRGDQRSLRSAKAIRINMDNSGRKEVTFAWVDGVYWQRWIRTTYGIDVKDGEHIIINDEDNRRYWDTTVTGNYILVSRTSIMETLDKIVYGPNLIKYKLTVSAFEKVLLDIRLAFSEHPWLSFGCVAGIGFGMYSWLRGRSRRRGGHFRLDDGMGIKDLKDGLLGMNGNHKAD